MTGDEGRTRGRAARETGTAAGARSASLRPLSSITIASSSALAVSDCKYGRLRYLHGTAVHPTLYYKAAAIY